MGSGASTRVRAPVLGRAVLVEKNGYLLDTWRSRGSPEVPAQGMDAEGVRAAVLLEDGLGARAHWRSHRGVGVDYAAFRAALVAERDARRRANEAAPPPKDGGAERHTPAMDPNLMSPASVVAAAFRRGADDDDEDEDDAGAIPVRRISSVVSGFDGDGDDASTRSGRSTASSSTVASSSHATTGALPTELHPSHPDLIFTPRRSRVTVARWSGHGGEKTLAMGRDTGEVELMRPNGESGGLGPGGHAPRPRRVRHRPGLVRGRKRAGHLLRRRGRPTLVQVGGRFHGRFQNRMEM